MIQINKSRLTLLTTTAAALLIFSASALAFFTNGGFEGGDFAGWTKLVFTNTGLTGSAPFSGSNIQRGAGGVDRTTVATGATMSISDPIVPAVLYPRFGTHAAVVNFWPANGVQPNKNANSLLQQSFATAGDIDPEDGLFHVRFAFLPVLEPAVRNELIVPRKSLTVAGSVVSEQVAALGAAELVMDHFLAPRASVLVMD